MAVLTQEQMDALIAERGGNALVHGTAGRKTVKNPSHNPRDLSSKEDVEAEVHQWIAPNGHKIVALQLPDGTWDVTDDMPPAPKPATTNTSTASPSVPPGSIPQIEGTPIPGKPGQFDNTQPIRVWHTPDGRVIYEPLTPAEVLDWERKKNGGKTNAEVEKERQEGAGSSNTTDVATHPGWTQTITTRRNPQTGVIETTKVFTGPNGEKTTSLPAKATSERKPVDGQPGVYLVSTTKDGKSETHFENEAGQTIQAPPNLPASIVSGGITYIRGEGNVYAPAVGIPVAGAGLKNVDPFEPDYTKPDLGFAAWAAKQRGKIGLPSTQGGITQTEYDSAVKQAHDQATVTVNNIVNQQSTQRQRWLDEQNQQNVLSNQGAADYAGSESAYLKDLLRYGDPNNPQGVVDTLRFGAQERSNARRNAASTATPPPPLHPMFGWTGQVPGQQGSGFTPTGPTAPTTPSPSDPAMAEAVRQAALASQREQAGPTTPVITAPIPDPNVAPEQRYPHPGMGSPTPPRPTPAVIEPPARANVPTNQRAGNERSDDILTLRNGRVLSRVMFDSDVREGKVNPDDVVNAESGSAFDWIGGAYVRRGTTPQPSLGKPGANPAPVRPNEGGMQNPGGTGLPRPADSAPVMPNPQMPVNVPYPVPYDPTSMLPRQPPVMAWAGPMLGGQQQPAPVMNAQMGAWTPPQPPQQMAFDPYPMAGRLLKMGAPQETILAALQELGWT